jgi:hypothetical protein
MTMPGAFIPDDEKFLVGIGIGSTRFDLGEGREAAVPNGWHTGHELGMVVKAQNPDLAERVSVCGINISVTDPRTREVRAISLRSPEDPDVRRFPRPSA